MSNILVGTSSWIDKTLIESGRFYPRSATTPEDRLRYYARQFPIVEIDGSSYGIPQKRMHDSESSGLQARGSPFNAERSVTKVKVAQEPGDSFQLVTPLGEQFDAGKWDAKRKCISDCTGA